MQIFHEISTARGKISREEPPRTVHFHFLEKPSRILLGSGDDHIAALELETLVNVLTPSGKQAQEPTGDMVTLPIQLLLKSVGYRGCALAGVPFDFARGLVPNVMGRVTAEDGSYIPGLYATGWIRRGPQGIIGTNIIDAAQTAKCVSEDLVSNTDGTPRNDVHELLKV
jgi:NADPH-dependent glutamate synthase beta subunit-like oxidoreductase